MESPISLSKKLISLENFQSQVDSKWEQYKNHLKQLSSEGCEIPQQTSNDSRITDIMCLVQKKHKETSDQYHKLIEAYLER